jgi:hypothetical protein
MAADKAREWLGLYLGETVGESIGRVGRSHAVPVDLFRLVGPFGVGMLAESWGRVEGRAGVIRTRTSAWMRQAEDESSYLVELELHSWDAGLESEETGDRTWLEVPRRRMYAERDRRSRAIADELDTFRLAELPTGATPGMLAGLSPAQVASLAAHYTQGLILDAVPAGA